MSFLDDLKARITAPKEEEEDLSRFFTYDQYALVLGEFDKKVAEDLLDNTEQYVLWLRVMLLRLALKTQARVNFFKPSGWSSLNWAELIGFENLEHIVNDLGIKYAQKVMASTLETWEEELGTDWCFPHNLSTNLKQLGTFTSLDRESLTVLGFIILLKVERIGPAINDMAGGLGIAALPRLLAAALNIPERKINKVLAPDSLLIRSGLLIHDIHNPGSHLLSQLRVMNGVFMTAMVKPTRHITDVFGGLIQAAGDSKLTLHDYRHMGEQVSIAKEFLAKAGKEHRPGNNILLYGPSGSGKSQLARVICREAGLRLTTLGTKGSDPTLEMPFARSQSCQLALTLSTKQPSALLMDDSASILATTYDDGLIQSLISQLLETNPVPTLWITENIEDLNPVYLHRFTLCIKVSPPPKNQRLEILKKTSGHVFSEALLNTLAEADQISPAILAKTSEALANLPQSKNSPEHLSRRAVMTFNDNLAAQGLPLIRQRLSPFLGNTFDPESINCQHDLTSLLEGLRETRTGRLCLFGPSGTGKTAFGRWIADELDMPHHILKASDLLAKYLGETETRIARAFESATQENAVLQFDEVDSFLRDRAHAYRHWEITQVNEMLTQLEHFGGIFIASTNLGNQLDPAALRRFDINLKFDFPQPAAVWRLYCAAARDIGLDPPQETVRQALEKLAWLTPGDFAQVVRRQRISPIRSHEKLLAQLDEIISWKSEPLIA